MFIYILYMKRLSINLCVLKTVVPSLNVVENNLTQFENVHFKAIQFHKPQNQNSRER